MTNNPAEDQRDDDDGGSKSPTEQPLPASGDDEGVNVNPTAADVSSAVSVDVGGSSSGGRKRRNDDHDRGGSGGKSRAVKRRPTANVPPVCALCGKVFASFPALFGHLNSHRDKPFRGAYPYDWDPSKIAAITATTTTGTASSATATPVPAAEQEAVVQALMDAAEETIAKLQQEQLVVMESNLGIDLNDQPPQSDDHPSMAAQEEEDSRFRLPDLNLSPPGDDDDDAGQAPAPANTPP